MTSLPKHKDIAQKNEFEIKINLKEILEKEETLFDILIADNNLNGLIARYPIRETPVLNGIASGLKLQKATYESAVRKLIIDDVATQEFYKSLLSDLTRLMN